MIYVKGTVPTGETVAVQITDNGIFCKCPVCGNETPMEYDIFAQIVDEGSLEECSQYCDPCSDKWQDENGKKPKLTRIK